jgi:CheY-like chemotaxis protein
MAARVLIVEDDESMRELLRLHLSGAGYDVATAEDGIAAGYAVLKTPPDLIICDIEMPKFPVIFLTSSQEADVRARELGACAFLTKPVLADWLLTAVRQALDGK